MPAKQPSYTGQPPSIAGKPIVESFPTPGLADRIYRIRKDSRAAGFELPEKGAEYAGPNADRYAGFKFATAKPVDDIGWLDLYYLNERANEDDYNFEISYPYVDKNFPMVTRTYVVLRGDQRANEPQADATDPVYPDLFLTDHKITRFQDQVLDALFVGVQRAYERLPGPVIVSYQMNGPQQVVTLETQTVKTEDDPALALSAVTEIAKTERTGTAKAQVTIGTTLDVFPDTRYQTAREEAVLPYKFRTAVPSVTIAEILAGDAVPPVLGIDDWSAEEHQTTEFKKQISTTTRVLSNDVVLVDLKITDDQQLATVTDTWGIGQQTLTPSALIIDGDVKQIGNGETLKSVTTIPDVFAKTQYTIQISDPVPEKFRVVVPVKTTELTTIGTAAPPALGTGELEKTDSQVKEFWHRTSLRYRDVTSLPVSLVEYKLTPEQLVSTIVETLDTGIQTITPADLLVAANVDNLGNNTSLLSETTVPRVFENFVWEVERPDPAPAKFRVLVPVESLTQTAIGLATLPTLGTGELAKKDEQVTDRWHRAMIRARSIGSLPVTLISRETSKDKQVVFVGETYQLENDPAYQLPTALQTVEVENMGDGTVVQTIKSVASVFGGISSAVEIPDLIPREFRIIVPTLTRAETFAGIISDPPTLGTGELSRKEQQLDVFTFRREITSRTGVTLPVSLTNVETTTEFGGGIANEIRTLEVEGADAIDEGLTVIASSIRKLGNGLELKETKQLNDSEWPLLTSSLWDDQMRKQYTETQQVVDAGSAPDPNPGSIWGWISEVKKIDKWRSVRINTSKDAPDYVDAASALIEYEMKPYKFPGYLQYSGNGYYTRQSTAVLVEHQIKTWWEKSVSTPTVAFDEIITGDVIINNLSNTGIEYQRDVLHDGFSFGIINFPATTPTATEYALGTVSGSILQNLLNLAAPGTGYTLGGSVTISGDGGFAVVTITGLGLDGSIFSFTPVLGSFGWPAGINGPYPGSGGAGSGALFYASGINVPTYTPGTAWIGSRRIIGGAVTHEKEPDIWKVQTESVIMR